MSRDSEEIRNSIWQTYVSAGFLDKVRPSDFMMEKGEIPNLHGMSFQESKALLKNLLTTNGWTRLDARFRKYKQRQLGQLTTITLHKKTLAKLEYLKSELAVDDYDMLFEYLLDPEENLSDILKRINGFPLSVTQNY
ncbi:hypothetical protein [Pseudoalteromonas luteoviolacea]|uniref:Uncharacterized protein n=1 Tax=Pseudoalteromonas luteoviolacea S4060-1 TaxID=1365257 RepID=A0A167MER6_9GAMM|nr:hypothetical protein [Pseudoalteromonas luteoviolacea]KZN66269.1 hypothetical protein N478_20345 [Pseudoalteromonas luteoviolacea S4060-1]